jgi:hypothetical protein
MGTQSIPAFVTCGRFRDNWLEPSSGIPANERTCSVWKALRIVDGQGQRLLA